MEEPTPAQTEDVTTYSRNTGHLRRFCPHRPEEEIVVRRQVTWDDSLKDGIM
jgi:hypothetical protein